MPKYENHCYDCATPNYPCRGSNCPNRKVLVQEVNEVDDDDDDYDLPKECIRNFFRKE